MEDTKTMRLPTCEEWDRLVETTDGNDEVMHWIWMYSWCTDASPYDPADRAIRGFNAAPFGSYDPASYRDTCLGFRPAIDLPDALGPDGSKIVMGTLYMGGQPVKIPQRPVKDEDVISYIPNTKLELKKALPDPAYQMMGIKVGSAAIADRAMLRAISWEDIQDVTKEKKWYMRLPTSEEWDQFADVADGKDEIMHWDKMSSWCDDVDPEVPAYRVCRGYDLARHRERSPISGRSAGIGFRPVVDLPADLASDGSQIVMGTLYMDGEPVRIPQKPTWTGDIMDYVPGAKLELRPALDDSIYQMVGIKVDAVAIADRTMIKGISWDDIQTAIDQELPQGKVLEMRLPTNEEWCQMVETTIGDDGTMHWQEMYSWCDGNSFRGFLSADHEGSADPACRADSIGFRPVASANSDDLIMGTLYMDGRPVPVPEHPTWDGDITDYVPGTKLELRPSLGRPKYQVQGIRVGDLLVADRAMLKQISLEDIEAAIS